MNSEVYGLKINMVCRMTKAMNMRLGNSKPIYKGGVKPIEESRKSFERQMES